MQLWSTKNIEGNQDITYFPLLNIKEISIKAANNMAKRHRNVKGVYFTRNVDWKACIRFPICLRKLLAPFLNNMEQH